MDGFEEIYSHWICHQMCKNIFRRICLMDFEEYIQAGMADGFRQHDHTKVDDEFGNVCSDWFGWGILTNLFKRI